MSKPVITRFAPSPTGFLHIGGARTALFNWLYAKANCGQMVLRIEDTDRKRSSEEATKAILDGLTWLGLDWDGEAISQFARAERHREVAHQLLETGGAYQCFASAQELEEARTQSRENATPMVYQWRDRDPNEAPKDAMPVIRLKSPSDGQTIVDDEVQGLVKFENQDLDDMVLLRSDGSPTYMHAVVVDDHDMGVTHIIRGDDHLTNAARQILLYKALGWDVPTMVHIPLIHGADGAKLSKRHGALGVEAYRAMGYLPAALLNYLVRLGWSHGDDEIISIAQMTQWFDTDKIGKGASRFDFTKLEYLNSHYIRETDDSDLVELLTSNAQYLDGGQQFLEQLNTTNGAVLLKAMPLIKEKSKTLNDLIQSASLAFTQRPVSLNEKAAKVLDEGAKAALAGLLPKLAKLNSWDAETLSQTVRDFCEETGIKLGKIAQPLRCAIAGTPAAPGVFEVMELFGKDEVLARLGDQAA